MIERALFLCAAGSILVTAGIILVLLFETTAFLREVPIGEFLFGTVWTPLFSDKHFGVLPLVARHAARVGDRDARRAAGRPADRRST